MLVDLPATGEPEVLEQLDRRAEQEPTLRLTPGGHLGDGLDEPTAALRDLLDGTLERGARDTLSAVFGVDEDAGDAPVRRRRRVLDVLAPVLDTGQLVGAAVLGLPLGHTVVDH